MLLKSLDLIANNVTIHHGQTNNTAKEGLVRIQYKCLVPISAVPEMRLHGLVIP
jgi:hypothetical protein